MERREGVLVQGINLKGQAILEGGAPWAEGILLFTVDPAPTEREERLIAERIQYWEQRITKANGRAE